MDKYTHINKFIKLFILSSLLINASAGLIGPIFAVFVVDDVIGGTIAVVGTAAGIYWIVKSILQIFVGGFLDRKQNENKDLAAMVLGNLIMGVVPFFYIFINTVMDLYILQFVLAIGGALAVPPWFTLFSHHLDAAEENFEWSLNSSISFGVGLGIAGLLGGYIADFWGFNILFVLAGIVGILSAIVAIPLHKYLNIDTSKEESASIENEAVESSLEQSTNS